MRLSRLLPLLGSVLLAHVALAQSPAPAKPPPNSPPASRPAAEPALPKLTAWPAVPAEKQEQLAIDVRRLCKARTPNMGAEARTALIELGACVVPSLLPSVEKESDEADRERVRETLTQILHAEHTRLLAKEFTSKLPAVRVFCLMRVAAYPDSALQPDAEKALAQARKLKPRELGPDELYAAALCAASTGSTAGLEILHERAIKHWVPRRDELSTALHGVRGKPATDALAPFLKHEERAQRLAAINMLSACGDKATAVPLVRPFLDETDGGLKIAAINALRGIVDGEPPIDNLSIFEAVEQAKAWLKRV